ncbi:MAG: hypothetical protein CMH22_05965 [Methylophaga sp.]|nr:hypothetical protein [Methylophaga sp.]|tara:strand:+ start:65929 stop:66243 length:315 start_codon:yes stop_codon:yes gene_type:complete
MDDLSNRYFGIIQDMVSEQKQPLNTFEEVTVDELNSIIDTELNEDMTFTEVYESLDRTEHRYFYISLNDTDVLEAIEDEREIAEQLDLWLVCIVPQCIYIALHQ